MNVNADSVPVSIYLQYYHILYTFTFNQRDFLVMHMLMLIHIAYIGFFDTVYI